MSEDLIRMTETETEPVVEIEPTGGEVLPPLSRMDALKLSIKGLPKNSYGLPEGIYRSDLFQDSSPQNLDACYVPISYQEGFPTIADGVPFWSQLDFEPPEAFQAFRTYLEMGREGTRQLFVLVDHPLIDLSLKTLNEYFLLYYWDSRARSYDLFKVSVLQRARESRIMSLEDNHYLISSRLLDRCLMYMGLDINDPEALMKRIGGSDDTNNNNSNSNSNDGDSGSSSDEDNEFWDLMTPKTAIDLLKALTQMQRTSLGLTPNGGAGGANSPNGGGAPQNVDITFNNLTNNGSPSMGNPNSSSNGSQENIDLLNLALQDPATASLAQELIIKINSRNSGEDSDG